MLCVAILTRESHSSISQSFDQMITLEGEVGVWKGPKYDPAILAWPVTRTAVFACFKETRSLFDN